MPRELTGNASQTKCKILNYRVSRGKHKRALKDSFRWHTESINYKTKCLSVGLEFIRIKNLFFKGLHLRNINLSHRIGGNIFEIIYIYLKGLVPTHLRNG